MKVTTTDIFPGYTVAQVVLPYDPSAANSAAADRDKQTFLPVIAIISVVLILLLLVVAIKRRRHSKSIYRDK